MLRRLTRERYLSDAELARFMAVIRERRHKHRPRDYALFSVLANTGMRPSEALALTLADLQLEGAEPLVRLHRASKPRVPEPINELVLHESVTSILRAHAASLPADPSGRVFAITRRQAERLFHYYTSKAGLWSGFKLFALRHGAGMRLWRTTRDLRLVQAILGHRQLESVAAYVHTSQEQVRRALDLADSAA